MDIPGKLSYKNYGKKYIDMLNGEEKSPISNLPNSDAVSDAVVVHRLQLGDLYIYEN